MVFPAAGSVLTLKEEWYKPYVLGYLSAWIRRCRKLVLRVSLGIHLASKGTPTAEHDSINKPSDEASRNNDEICMASVDGCVEIQ